MTVKRFRKIIREIIENSEQFVTYINDDECFEKIGDDAIVVNGETENDSFVLKIIKIK